MNPELKKRLLDVINKQIEIYQDKFANGKVKEKYFNQQISKLQNKYKELKEIFMQHTNQTTLCTENMSDLENIKSLKDLLNYEFKRDLSYKINSFIKTFNEEKQNMKEVLNYIPIQTAEYIQTFSEYNVTDIIQSKPIINDIEQRTSIYGVLFTDQNHSGQEYIRITDLISKEQDEVLIAHLMQALEITFKKNNFITQNQIEEINNQLKKDNQALIQSVTTLIGGHIVTYGKNESLYEMCERYVKIMKQPNKEFYIEEAADFDPLSLAITILISYEKAGRYIQDLEFEKQMKQTILLVKNTEDDDCLYGALFIGLTYKCKQENNSFIINNQYFNVTFDKNIFSENRMLSNYNKIGVSSTKNLYYYTQQLKNIIQISNTEHAQNEQLIIKKFNDLFKINVTIVSYNEPFKSLPKQDDIILLKQKNHYNVIKQYQQAIRNITNKYNDVYCFEHQIWATQLKKCNKCFDNQYCHFCNKYHKLTKSSNKISYICKECNFEYFYEPTNECLERHKKICPQMKECEHCNKIHYIQRKCKQQAAYEDQHFKAGKMHTKNENFMVYDIETMYVSCPENSKYKAEQTPFLINYRIAVFNKETNEYEMKEINYDNKLQHLKPGTFIINNSPFEAFIEIINQAQIQFKIKYVYAHNGAKFDTKLFLSYIIHNNVSIEYETLFNGGRLIQLSITTQSGEVLIKDSLLILNTPLSSFQKAFDIDSMREKYNIAKVNKFEQSYTFLTSNMFQQYLQNGGKSETIKYYYENGGLNRQHFNDGVFNDDKQFEEEYINKYGDEDFINQYIKYCQQDVNITMLGLIKMTQLMFCEDVNILNYLTLPSIAYNLYLHHAGENMFQQEYEDFNFNRSQCEQKLIHLFQSGDIQKINQIINTERKVPIYNFTRVQVIDTNMRFDQYNIDIVIQAYGAGDIDLGKYLIEVNGVYFHGLVKLDKNHQNYQLMIERKEHHDKKQRYILSKLKQKGYQELINITDTQINDFNKNIGVLDTIKQQHNINNRDIYRGGRTEYYYNLYTLNDNQCLKGLDYTSLYPSMMLQNLPLRGLVVGKDYDYVNKLIQYAQSITGTPEQRLEKYFQGCDSDKRIIQVKCKILPPQNLNYPVLCLNINNKLLSPLCRTCADTMCKDVKNNAKCTHNEDERALYGFFDEIELIHAINLGYQILEVFQTHLYQTTSFNDNNFKGNQYMKHLVYYKTLNSGVKDYTEDVLEQLKQAQVINNYTLQLNKDNEPEVVQIQQNENDEYKNIKENKALKTFYKLMMNAIYGKTGQSKIRRTHIIGDINFYKQEYNNLIHKDLKMNYITDKTIVYDYNEAEEIQMMNRTQSNAAVSGRVTALSRTCLYQLQQHVMEQYQGTVLYSDTDSVYCILNKKYKDLSGFSFKNTFGVKAEEKLKNVTEFVCIAPKQYGYKNINNEQHCTSKGISLNYKDQVNVITYGPTCLISDNTTQSESLYDIYKKIVLNPQTKVLTEQNKNFVTDKQTLRIFKQDQNKYIQIQERKRISLDKSNNNINTIPFGYI
ncbi:Conserved_hypothetical protein [Hexamita inflata]|uniref:DNA-directed DNA polymerase n=1 Tax=Hexamita inflata TaxID=28002 RepID=A0AA86UB83_9EUKA|nr:Conserved hypothetical protein [Hexamita inflata]